MMKIRALTGQDRSVVLDMIHSLGIFTREEELVAAELIDSYLSRPDQQDYIINVAENEHHAVVGYVCYGPKHVADGVFDIYWLAVSSGVHRQGYGRRLVQFTETKIRERNGRLVVIETSSGEKYAPARALYERTGYAALARIGDFYRPGEDLLIYCKYLKPEDA